MDHRGEFHLVSIIKHVVFAPILFKPPTLTISPSIAVHTFTISDPINGEHDYGPFSLGVSGLGTDYALGGSYTWNYTLLEDSGPVKTISWLPGNTAATPRLRISGFTTNGFIRLGIRCSASVVRISNGSTGTYNTPLLGAILTGTRGSGGGGGGQDGGANVP